MAARRKDARNHLWLPIAAAALLLALLIEPVLARALVPPLPVAAPLARLGLPVPGTEGEQDPNTLWALGGELTHRGEYARAADLYGSLAARLGADAAPRALLLQARAALDDGDTAMAEQAAEQVVAAYGSSDQAATALFLAGRARMQGGDFGGALEAFDQYEARGGGAVPASYVWLQRAECYARIGDAERQLAAAKQALAVDGGGPRLAQIDALERAADAAQKLGSDREALDDENRLLKLASTRAYRAQLLSSTGKLARKLGMTDTAADRFRSLVLDYPEQPSASEALDALDDLGVADSVTAYQAGAVRLNGRAYDAALQLFAQVPGDAADADHAAYAYGVALLRLGRESDAIDHFREVADRFPSIASTAMLRAARLLESDARYAEAATAYERVRQVADGTSDADTALYRLGLTRYLMGDLDRATEAWQSLADPLEKAAPAQRAAALYWQGKVLARSGGDPRALWSSAASTAAGTYYAFRAEDALAGGASPRGRAAEAAPADFQRAASDNAELAAWLASRGTSPQALERTLAAEPALGRADALLAVGLQAEAGWEVEPVVQQAVEGREAGRLAALGDWLAARDLAQAALRAGLQARDLAGQPLLDLPRAVQKQVYPAGWGDVAVDQAAARGVDPLLLLALVRQESSFDPRARSGAGALGLAQLMPATAAGIARSLGSGSDVQPRDLFKPAVSLDFGAYYLAEQLRRYDGQVLPALAAYNAGGGNSDRWLADWSADPDLFVEEIPFAETQHYVQVVYENYRNYLRLYGG